MCGRYHFGILPDKKGKKIKERAEKLNLVYKEGEIFPSDRVLCIVPAENKIDLVSMKWGIQNKILQINARVESLNDRPTYEEIRKNRCAVICNGFYEWDRNKNKHYVTFEEDYMYLACIFNKKGELLILTRSADENFTRIHDRMPIVMNQAEMLKFIHNEDTVFQKKKMNILNLNEEISLF
ncbi:MAG: SOS response-associated peptidase family protein [Erysipelotrichaceae bacterium]|nr:SOS response-associated peptidase family protein [Erysipelotrichaceae bacterium]